MVYALYNSKGGVGKTASAVNFAYLSAEEGKKTLLWDLDPQAASTFYLKIRPHLKGGAKKLAKGKTKFHKAIQGTEFDRLDVLPAELSERNLDLILDDMKKPRKRLRGVVKQFADDYDVIFLDCPPGMSLVSENVFAAADYLLLPLIPSVLSKRSYDQVVEYFSSAELDPARILPFFTLVDRRKKMHSQHVSAEAPSAVSSYVPYASDIERMGERRAPVFSFANSSKAAAAYREVWRQLQRKTLE
jgi:cellulose biosynthesis protein BcsQ